MPDLQRQALVPYSAEVMYEIVNRCDFYPEFLPWCSEGKIIESTDETMTASIFMKKGPLDQAFSTQNTMIKCKEINIYLLDGPFKKLEGKWVFTNIANHGSKVELELSYEFSNSIISMVVGPVFNQIANTLVDSFCKRAESLYG